MRFQIGEKVVFIHESGGGVIRSIQGNTCYVEDETGFERPFRIDDIAKIHGTTFYIPEDEQLIQQLAHGIETVKNKSNQQYTKHKDHWEIDLHFEDLIEVYGDQLRRQQDQALLKQLAVFKDFYYKARTKKVRKLIVIHGFGKGILRDEIHTFLRGQNGVDFFDASYTDYGHGATQIEIRYKF